MTTRIIELFSMPTVDETVNWKSIVANAHCPYINKNCDKRRKSNKSIIGTCSIIYGVRDRKRMVICPHRFLERNQIFLDCIHLLTLHEPGNELHLIRELAVPGGSVDYVLVSVKEGKIVDFVGIEIQALDTTGTVWPERQRFLHSMGLTVEQEDLDSDSDYAMNWKHTLKTTLLQLHHKIETFENLNKKFVLVLQDHLVDDTGKKFRFDHVQTAKLGDTMHFHAYTLKDIEGVARLNLSYRLSTDVNGVALFLERKAAPKAELASILSTLQTKISNKTILKPF